MEEIPIRPQPPESFVDVIGPERTDAFLAALAAASAQGGGRTLWHVNSTAQGGGVAEMLQSTLGYLVAGGVPCRWLVVDGNEEFFAVTKQVHYLLHGSDGDGPALDDAARRTYEQALAADAERIADLVRPGDVVVLNDPQTLGLAPALREAGAKTVFTCHVGADEPNASTRAVWEFLSPYVRHTDRQVFSRPAYAWEGLDPRQVVVIPPCLDAFSSKNQPLSDDAVAGILSVTGLVPDGSGHDASFTRQDGTRAEVRMRAHLDETAPVPPDALLVTQVSRWDPLKDPVGVLEGFARHVPQREPRAHLLLAGPSPDGVTDDPDGAAVLADVRAAWAALPDEQRSRVHVACLPMDDLEENGAVVNALQRRADVVVQKSLAEGFGLTVAEAMWKRRAVVGSRVGGIQDQLDHGRSGVLLDDPRDPDSLGAAVAHVLADADGRERMGAAAHEQVRERYLAPTHLGRYLDLAGSL